MTSLNLLGIQRLIWSPFRTNRVIKVKRRQSYLYNKYATLLKFALSFFGQWVLQKLNTVFSRSDFEIYLLNSCPDKDSQVDFFIKLQISFLVISIQSLVLLLIKSPVQDIVQGNLNVFIA